MNNMCDQCPNQETYKRALIWVNIEEKFQQYAAYCKECWTYELDEVFA